MLVIEQHTALELLRRAVLRRVLRRHGIAHDDWGIRERQFVTVLANHAMFTGKRLTCRVLGRSLPAGSQQMPLQLQVIPDGSVKRLPPATRSTRANVRGRGSFASEFRLMRSTIRLADRT